MRILMTCALALLILPLLPAQDGVAAKDAKERPSAHALAAKFTAEMYRQKREHKAARDAVFGTEAYKKARQAKDREKMKALLKDLPQPRLIELGNKAIKEAENYQGDERAVLLVWAASKTKDKGIVTKVIADVLKNHLDSIEVIPLLEFGMNMARQLGREKGREFLNKFAFESKNDYVRAWGMYKVAGRLGRGPDASDEDKAKRAKMMAEVEKLAAGTELGDILNAPKFVKERLQIGMEIPEIVGKDMDGVAFKLSDYRGKVVVLDFWGFW